MRSIIFLSLLLFCSPVWAALTPQQAQFQQAREALKQGHSNDFQRLYRQLEGYPLRPYLDVWRYWNKLDAANDERVRQVLAQYKDIPEANDLRIRWIKALAKRQQWKEVAKQLRQLPKGRHPDRRINLLSMWHNQQRPQAIQSFTPYWRKITHLDARLKPIERQWRKQGHPTADDLWYKINRQVKKGHWKSALKTAKPLRKRDQEWLRYWRSAQADPATWLKKAPKSAIAQGQMAKVFDDVLRRYAKKDVIDSHRLFMRHVKPRLAAMHQGRLLRHIALRGAYQHRLEAIDWLESLGKNYRTDTTRTWPVRLLLLNHRWTAALAEINALPSRIRNKESSRWNYWKARCFEALGQREKAMTIYRKLATERGYYSFLSADKAGSQYQIRERRRAVNAKALKEMKQLPAMRRAAEWVALEQLNKAYREWSQAMRKRSKEQWYAAMTLADRWGWAGQALRAASRARAHDRLDIRFPMAFYDEVIKHAQRTSLKPSLVWSVMRQESLFNPSIASPVGARGLMQLMPKTARAVAKQFPKMGKHFDLTVPETNITLGTTYLAGRLAEFDGHVPLAVASYNAGPHRVSQWLKQTPYNDPELWIEGIPFNETRNYVQRIMAYRVIYDWRLGKTRLNVL